jgi:hypothetical protein
MNVKNRQRDDPPTGPARKALSGVHSRRSLRKAAFLPIWLRNEGQRPIWEEETETHVVSRYGAGLYCQHFVQPENMVIILRRDNGRRANARVTYVRYDPDGKRELGIEFIDKDNFWDLDWNSSDQVEAQSERVPVLSELIQCEPEQQNPSPEAIRNRAYMIYCERGARGGHDLEDWLEAERELNGTIRLTK